MNKPARLFASAVLGILASGSSAAAAGNANLISVDFVACDSPRPGMNTVVSGDTSTSVAAQARNADGLVFTGQDGPWNAVKIDPDCNGNYTYAHGLAASGCLTNGAGNGTTVKFGIASAYRCNLGDQSLTNYLRNLSADCDLDQSTANPLLWYITGLVPHGSYQLALFSSAGGAYEANGLAAERDSEGDANWSSLQANDNGTISGSLKIAGPRVSMYGFQLYNLNSRPGAGKLTGQLALAGLGLGLALLWALRLRRQLKQKSRELTLEVQARREAAVEFQATLRERKRLAANLHDTLLQTITGLGYQIEACEAESLPLAQRKADHLGTARRMVQRAQDDLRGTVWALRALPLHGHTLAEALRILADQLAEGRPVKITVEAELGLPSLSDFVAGNLLLVAQEAIYNALKHAQAGRIEVQVALTRQGEYIMLLVRDDGVGFDSAEPPHSHPGHFGLEGMRERLQRLGGELRVESQPGRGTTLQAEVPCNVLDEEPG